MPENSEPKRSPDATGLQESLEELYEDAPCGYISTYPDGTFVKVNRTFLAWTGYPPEELLAGKRFQDLLTVGSKIFHETHFAPLLRMQGFVNEIAVDLVSRTGQKLPVIVNAVQKRDASGTPLLNRTTLFKATDRREFEHELQRARRQAEHALHLRDEFLSLAAHELKTPLTSLLGNLQLFQRRVSKEYALIPRDQRTLQIVIDQTQRLNKMIVSLFDISRLETGQLSIEQKPFDVVALIHRIVDEVQSMLAERRVELQCPPSPLVIHGDELRLEQVFQNLIQNAVKYSSRNSPIVVAVHKNDGQVAVSVSDAGIGIPHAAVSQLFQRFYRANNVEQEKVSGLGIGLYVVKEIVELHGGTVTVDSIEGKGSTFTVFLPLSTTSRS